MILRHAVWATLLMVLMIAVPAVANPGEKPKPVAAQPSATAKKPSTAKPAESKPPAATAAKAKDSKKKESAPRQPSVVAPAPATPPTASASAPGAVDAATYTVRLRDLESRVDELKEQIRRSHTRLSLLSDTILSGGIGGAEADIVFLNEMSNAFRVTRVLFVLDGAVQYKKQDDTGALSGQKTIPIFSGAVPPGDHTLQVVVGMQGHGYGVFSYLRGYKFEVKSTHSFTVTEGKAVKLEAIAWEKGGVTTPLEQRPAVRFTEKVLRRGGQ